MRALVARNVWQPRLASHVGALASKWTLTSTRGYAEKPSATGTKRDMAAARLQRQRNANRLQAKRIEQRDLSRQRALARLSVQAPTAMDLSTAMRYIRAAEVGQPASRTTLVLRVQIVDDQAGPKLTGALRLPKPVGGGRIAVVTGSAEAAKEARAAGAQIVANETLLIKIANGEPIEFDRLYATPDMSSRLISVARILGPRGLMPSVKRGTITPSVGDAIEAAKGETVVKQTHQTISMNIGLAAFTDLEIARNIDAVLTYVREQLAATQAKRKGYPGRVLLTSSNTPAITLKV